MTKFLELEQKMREKCADLFDNTDIGDAIKGTYTPREESVGVEQNEVDFVRDAVWQMIILALYEAKEEGLV